ncbi:NADP-dependent oxidoreductase domain [Trinorchestia longiramus]|nr:NADP-dependent oxidoreductase domain [Trinorchestia longiramus]
MATKVPSVTLNTGASMPILGLGTWAGWDVDNQEAVLPSEREAIVDAIKHAVDVGYRHFDCAMLYGNEAEIGKGLRSKIEEGVVKREELFIVAKEGDEFFPQDATGKMIYGTEDYVDTWRAMEECVQLGLTKAIGVSNFNKRQLERIMAASTTVPAVNQSTKLVVHLSTKLVVHQSTKLVVHQSTKLVVHQSTKLVVHQSTKLVVHQSTKLVVHQSTKLVVHQSTKLVVHQSTKLVVESHPYLTQSKLLDFCTSKGIVITAYSPLCSPGSRDWTLDLPHLTANPKVLAIAEKHGKSACQVLIKFQVQRGVVCIPKSTRKERIKSNFEIFDFELSQEEMEALLALDCNGRLLTLPLNVDHPEYPFSDEY